MVTRSSRSFHKACIWSRPLGWQVVHGSLHIDSLDYHYELLAAWLRFFKFETLSSEGNENGKKQTNKQTAISLTGKEKNNFARAAHFYCTFLRRCFVRLQRETSRNVLITRFMEEESSVFLFTFFFTVAHFHRNGRQHPATTKFHVVPPTKMSPFVFCLSLSAPFLVELRSVALLSLFLCLSFSLYSKFVDMTINLSLILKTAWKQKHFPLSVFVFIDSFNSCLCFTRRR